MINDNTLNELLTPKKTWSFKESTVFDKKYHPLFYVAKYNGTKYLGENSLVDDIEDAKAFEDYNDASFEMDDFLDKMDLKVELEEELPELIELEKQDWEDEYDSQPKEESGLIDEWGAYDILKKRCEIKGIYATDFEE